MNPEESQEGTLADPHWQKLPQQQVYAGDLCERHVGQYVTAWVNDQAQQITARLLSIMVLQDPPADQRRGDDPVKNVVYVRFEGVVPWADYRDVRYGSGLLDAYFRIDPHNVVRVTKR